VANFIQRAIKRPGALRAKARRRGLIKGDEPLSQSDLDELRRSGDTRTKRQVALARTLKRLARRRKKAA
jgi:hypothetical protein